MASRAGSTWLGASCRRFTIRRVADARSRRSTEDAYRMAKRLAREEAMLVSPSAAAALVGCMQVAASLDESRARRDRHDLPRCRREISERALLGRKRRFLGAGAGAVSMRMLILSNEIAQGIRGTGRRDYPNETCGAMLGVDGKRTRGKCASLFPLTNRRDDSPRNRFSITADDFRAAERAAEQQGLELIGLVSFPPRSSRHGPASSIASTPGPGIAT